MILGVLAAIAFECVLLVRLQWGKGVDDALYTFGSTAAVELASQQYYRFKVIRAA